MDKSLVLVLWMASCFIKYFIAYYDGYKLHIFLGQTLSKSEWWVFIQLDFWDIPCENDQRPQGNDSDLFEILHTLKIDIHKDISVFKSKIV